MGSGRHSAQGIGDTGITAQLVVSRGVRYSCPTLNHRGPRQETFSHCTGRCQPWNFDRDYTQRLGQPPTAVVPGAYAMW